MPISVCRFLEPGTGVWGAAILLAAATAGCEPDAGRLVQEINEARQGCTQDMLAAGGEECVQMFEDYIGMGTEAMEGYIGALRAFEEALDRHGPIQFDTAGLGHALSPTGAARREVGEAGTQSRWQGIGAFDRSRESEEAGGFDWASTPDGRLPTVDRSFGDPSRDGRLDDSRVDPYGFDERAGVDAPRSGRSRASGTPEEPASGTGLTAPPRGAILPPSERLRRPWIDDDLSRSDYTPDRIDPRTGLEPER